ncbi:MAG: HAMP domain-containing histidine kinase [Nitrospira sp.]|nr:HAMP domain-containing histidine kinase [Nitrospira sp.]
MRTKLFCSFIAVILLALLSNVVFEKLIIRDFNNYILGTAEDRTYWIMASVEGSHSDSGWNMTLLAESVHWSMMLGFETYIEDMYGEKVLSSTDVLATMNPNMITRMSSLLNLTSITGEFTWYPLFAQGEELGKLYVRPVEKLGTVALKEEIFRQRGKEFLAISFLIAGGGAVALSFLFSSYLSKPIRRLTASAEKIAGGDFSVRQPVRPRKKSDEIDRLTSTFNYMAEALRKEDELRKHLTSNIAHELRTPLTIIKGNLEAVDDGIITDTKTVMATIRQEIHRIIELVEGIEDVTRAEASFFRRGEPETINLKHFIEDAVSPFTKLAERKNIYIKTSGPSLNVETYPDKLHIILKNLLSNAYKFTDSGGITIHWNSIERTETKGFYIDIEDTGRGIETASLPEIFKRFHKGEDSDGKGLGLSIVQELVRVIGGEVEVSSHEGTGSKFKLRFYA